MTTVTGKFRVAAGIAAFVAGLLFVWGWLSNRYWLVQVSEHFAPVQFNASVALTLIGLSFVLSVRNEKASRWLRILFGLLPALFGLLTLFEYLSDIDFQIDQIAFHPAILTGSSHPGRISPNSGVAFIALGIAMMLSRPKTSFGAWSVIVLHITSFVVGAMSLFGYFSGVTSGYHWGDFTQMPPQLAVAFVVLGTAGLAFALERLWRTSPEKSVGFLAGAAALLILGSAFGVWNALRLDESAKYSQFLTLSAKEFSLEVKEKIESRFRGFIGNARFWDSSSEPDELVRDLEHLVRQNPHIRLIAARNKKGDFLLTIPGVGATPEKVEAFLKGLAREKEVGHPRADRPQNIDYWPNFGVLIFSLETAEGSVANRSEYLQIIDLDTLLRPIAMRFADEGHAFRILQGMHPVYASVTNLPEDPDVSETDRFQIGDLHWSVKTYPSKKLERSMSSLVPELVLFLGAVAAMLAFIAVQLMIQQTFREHEFRLARKRADDANRSKSEFLANMSHEIRTPLNAIMGFAELLSTRERKDGSVEASSQAEGIMRNCDLLGRLIDDILDLSKIEAGRLTVERTEVSLIELAHDVRAFLAQRARKKGVVLNINARGEIPDVVETDPTRLRQILINIIGNAIKFTDHGHVNVEFSVSKFHEYLEITVSDSGIGLTEEQIPRLFQPFTQADTTTNRRYGGTGLGLALSKRLAQALGGDIRLVSSKPGEGTTFEAKIALSIPYGSKWIDSLPVRVLGRQAAVAKSPYPVLSGRTILVVDDAPDNRFITASFVELSGAKVETAENGRQAIERVMAGGIDLILMDIQMPVMSGYEATAELRVAGYGGPIIALTANALVEERDRTMALGFSDYLSKPVAIERLMEVLRRWLSSQISDARAALAAESDIELEEETLDPSHLDEIQRKVLPLFVESMKERMERLGDACTKGDFDEIAGLCHQIKGVAGAMGFKPLGRMAFEMESRARARSGLDEIETMVRKMTTAVAGLSAPAPAERSAETT